MTMGNLRGRLEDLEERFAHKSEKTYRYAILKNGEIPPEEEPKDENDVVIGIGGWTLAEVSEEEKRAYPGYYPALKATASDGV